MAMSERNKKRKSAKKEIPDPSKKVKDKNRVLKEILFSIPVIVIALLWFIEGSYVNQDFCDPHKSENCSAFLRVKMRQLSEKHKNQPRGLWLGLLSAATMHVVHKPKPDRPIVIMAYNCHDRPIQGESIYNDISRAYEAVLSSNMKTGSLEINSEDFAGMDSDAVQDRILTAFENGYGKEGIRVATVHNFDSLPSCSVLTFHKLCNNDDAPYKDMAIILTVRGKKEDAEVTGNKKLEKIISEKFHDKWKDCPEYLPRDKIDAIMLSRIANNVVILK